MRVIILATLLLAAVWFPCDGRSEMVMQADQLIALLSESGKLQMADIESGLGAFSKERAETQRILIEHLLAVDGPLNSKACAAVLLGLYRMEGSVDALSKAITLELPPHVNDGLGLVSQFPAVQSLIQIGKPAVKAVLRNLENSDDEHVRGLSTRVIFYVEGPECGKLVMQKAIEEQRDAQKKKRLEMALPLLRGGEYVKPRG